MSAFAMNTRGSSEYLTTSIFSPSHSVMTVWILVPALPTVEPTGSISVFLVSTATFVLIPACLAIALISTSPEEISGTSFSIRAFTNSFEARERRILTPPFFCCLPRIASRPLFSSPLSTFSTKNLSFS